MRELIIEITKSLEKLQYKTEKDLENFQQKFESEKSRIFNVIRLINDTSKQKEIVSEIINYLETNIQKYPRKYRSLLWEHVKSWEFESSIVRAFIDELRDEHDLLSPSTLSNLWSSAVSTYTTIRSLENHDFIKVLLTVIIAVQFIESAKAEIADNNLNFEADKSTECFTHLRQYIIQQTLAHKSITEIPIPILKRITERDQEFLTGLLEPAGTIFTNEEAWCIEGIRALLTLFTEGEAFNLNCYTALFSAIKADNAEIFNSAIPQFEVMRKWGFSNMPLGLRRELQKRVRNYAKVTWVDLNYMNPNEKFDENCPMDIAILNGSLNTLVTFIQHGANLNSNIFFDRRYSFITLSIKAGHPKITEALMEKNAPLYAEEIKGAEFQEMQALLELELQVGKKINYSLIKKLASYRNASKLLTLEQASTILYLACTEQDAPFVKYLVSKTKARADFLFSVVGSYGTPLLAVIQAQNKEILDILLSQGNLALNQYYKMHENFVIAAGGQDDPEAAMTARSKAYAILGSYGTDIAKEIVEKLEKAGAIEAPEMIITTNGMEAIKDLQEQYNIPEPEIRSSYLAYILFMIPSSLIIASLYSNMLSSQTRKNTTEIIRRKIKEENSQRQESQTNNKIKKIKNKKIEVIDKKAQKIDLNQEKIKLLSELDGLYKKNNHIKVVFDKLQQEHDSKMNYYNLWTLPGNLPRKNENVINKFLRAVNSFKQIKLDFNSDDLKNMLDDLGSQIKNLQSDDRDLLQKINNIKLAFASVETKLSDLSEIENTINKKSKKVEDTRQDMYDSTKIAYQKKKNDFHGGIKLQDECQFTQAQRKSKKPEEIEYQQFTNASKTKKDRRVTRAPKQVKKEQLNPKTEQAIILDELKTNLLNNVANKIKKQEKSFEVIEHCNQRLSDVLADDNVILNIKLKILSYNTFKILHAISILEYKYMENYKNDKEDTLKRLINSQKCNLLDVDKFGFDNFGECTEIYRLRNNLRHGSDKLSQMIEDETVDTFMKEITNLNETCQQAAKHLQEFGYYEDRPRDGVEAFKSFNYHDGILDTFFSTGSGTLTSDDIRDGLKTCLQNIRELSKEKNIDKQNRNDAVKWELIVFVEYINRLKAFDENSHNNLYDHFIELIKQVNQKICHDRPNDKEDIVQGNIKFVISPEQDLTPGDIEKIFNNINTYETIIGEVFSPPENIQTSTCSYRR